MRRIFTAGSLSRHLEILSAEGCVWEQCVEVEQNETNGIDLVTMVSPTIGLQMVMLKLRIRLQSFQTDLYSL